jgi:hypothetical protein
VEVEAFALQDEGADAILESQVSQKVGSGPERSSD